MTMIMTMIPRTSSATNMGKFVVMGVVVIIAVVIMFTATMLMPYMAMFSAT